ncbi:MAG: porin [Massilia sp.]
MNKMIIAVLASSLVPAAAMAQSSVTVYGVADAGLVRESGSPTGTVNAITSGVASGSRLGFKGKEDLGNGVKAYFVLENGFNIDTGSAAQGGLLFGRQAYLGMSSELGAVTVGRQYSPYYRAMRDIGDVFCAGFAGRAGNILASNTRLDNMVSYVTPSLQGFTAELAVGLGEVPDNAAAKRAYSSALTYTAGPLVAALSWHQQQNALATDSSANTLLTARYNFGVAEASAGYARNKGLAGARSNDVIVGVIVPAGAVTKVYASYIHHDDTTAAARDASQWAFGATYALSKRTDLYAAYAHIDNRNGATFKVGNATTDGTGNTGVNLGIRHTF